MNCFNFSLGFANQETDFLQGTNDVNLKKTMMKKMKRARDLQARAWHTSVLNLLTDYLHIHFVTEFEFIRVLINRDPALISAFFSSLNKYQVGNPFKEFRFII